MPFRLLQNPLRQPKIEAKGMGHVNLLGLQVLDDHGRAVRTRKSDRSEVLNRLKVQDMPSNVLADVAGDFTPKQRQGGPETFAQFSFRTHKKPLGGFYGLKRGFGGPVPATIFQNLSIPPQRKQSGNSGKLLHLPFPDCEYLIR